MLGGKKILWLDPKHTKTKSSDLRSIMRRITKENHYEKLTLRPATTVDNVLEQLGDENRGDYDLVITTYGEDGIHAFSVLQRVSRIRHATMDMKSVRCPMVIVHDDDKEYEEEISEEIKGKVIRMGAVDYTTDAVSLASALMRAFSVSEGGRDRKNAPAVPGMIPKYVNNIFLHFINTPLFRDRKDC